MEMIDGQVTRATESERGDWKPVVYTLTDGRPTTDISAAAERWRTKYANRADLIGIAIGQFADLSSLAQITDNVIVFNPKEPGDLGDLVKWVSASISIQSTSLEATTGVNLAKTEGLDLSFLDNLTSPLSVDEKVAVVPAKCASQGKNYVLKYANPYAKFPELHEEIKAQFGDREVYLLEGAFPVGDDYHAWSDPSLAAAVINTNKLLGATQCPICGAPHAFAICSCGIVHCVQGTGTAQCPGCGKHSNYDVAPPDDEGDEISRGLG
jgi:hypothetical protein